MTAETVVPPAEADGMIPDSVEEMIRVDHAGEYGAIAIHRGQNRILARQSGNDELRQWVEETQKEEQAHLDAFDALVLKHRVRPTALFPVWRLAGEGLGMATALMGKGYVYACIEAVEEVIEEHYDHQVATLTHMGRTGLAGQFAAFRDDESEHRRQAAEHADAPAAFKSLIRAGCRLAIAISKRV